MTYDDARAVMQAAQTDFALPQYTGDKYDLAYLRQWVVDQVVTISPTFDPASEDKAGLLLEGFTAPDHYPALVDALRNRGYDGERLDAIMSSNWLRVLRQTLPAA